MNRRLLNLLIIFIVAAVFVSPASSSHATTNAQQVTCFLEPPYYGTTTVTSVFDHQLPLWPGNDGNNWTMHYDGVINGPGARSSYDQHRGIDYALRYELVRAAAPGTVAQAGWASTDHRASYGLHVRIDHADGFRTIYGHMSVLRVQTGDPIPVNADEFQRIIGRSGNTGWCQGVEGTGPNGRCTDNDPPTCGAHLHFQVEHNGRVVNPYGWIGNFADPWSQRPDGATSVDRWTRYPSITNGDVFTSGAPLLAPPMALDEPGYFIVDDGDADFNETTGCWTVDNTAGWNNDYRRRNIPGGNCTATWNFSQTRTDGRYNVFVHIPNDNVAPGNRRATVDAARYSIRHTPSPSQPWSKQTQIVVVDQWVYPNNAHTSMWVYLGAYYFDTNQYGTDYVRLESDTLDSRAGVMAADAVRFAPVVYRVYLPLVVKRWPPIPDVPVLNPIHNPDEDGNYTVSWQPAYLADTYILQEATNANFVGAVTRYSGTSTSWSATDKAAGTYYYRVRATNSYGDSGWSNVEQTTVLPPTTFYTVKDTTILQGYPDHNFWNTGDMWAGYDTYLDPDGQIARSLVGFDLSAIPAGTSISQATLRLYVWKSYDYEGASRTITTYRITSWWSETGATWNTQPTRGEAYGSASITHGDWGWYPFDVTDLVRGWVNGSFSNYGVAIRGEESADDPNWRGFCTRECPEEYRPYLVIAYSGFENVSAHPVVGTGVDSMSAPTIVDVSGGSSPEGESSPDGWNCRSQWEHPSE